MPFGSRRIFGASGTQTTPTIIEWGGTDFFKTATVSNDINGNTVLGNGTYSVATLPGDGPTAGFINSPMVIELTPGRVYSFAFTRSGSGTSSVPRVISSVDTGAVISLHLASIANLSNPPFVVRDQIAGGSLGALSSDEPVASGSDFLYRFNNEPWVNDRKVTAEAVALGIDNSAPSGGTNIGLFPQFNVNNRGDRGQVRIELVEGYYF